MVEAGKVHAIPGENAFQVLGTSEPGQDRFGRGLPTLGRRAIQFEQPGQLTRIDGLIDGPVSQRSEGASLETHLDQAKRIRFGCAPPSLTAAHRR